MFSCQEQYDKTIDMPYSGLCGKYEVTARDLSVRLSIKICKKGTTAYLALFKGHKKHLQLPLIFTNTLDHVHYITAYLVFISVIIKPQEVTSAGQEIVQQTLCKIANCQFYTFFLQILNKKCTFSTTAL